MLRRQFLAVVSIGLMSRTKGASAGEADPRFPSNVASRVGGKPARLVLTGSAIRKKYGFSVYAVASYVQEGVKLRDADGLARADVAKQLHLIFEREVDGRTIATSFRDSIGANHPAPAFSTELASLSRYFESHGAKQGDQIRLTHVPGVGLEVQVNEGPSLRIAGIGFARAAWEAYLGPNNVGVAIKAGLTSRLR